jgi:hypothetical protein
MRAPPAVLSRLLLQGGPLPRRAGAFLLSKFGDEFREWAGLRVMAEIFDLLFGGQVFDFLVDFGFDLPLEGQAVKEFFSYLTHPTLPPWA